MHESYNEVKIRLHTENQPPWYSGSGLNQMGKVQQQQQHIVYVGTCCAGYTHLFKLIIQPTQLGLGLSLAGVWQNFFFNISSLRRTISFHEVQDNK